jgi:hypothetical protein
LAAVRCAAAWVMECDSSSRLERLRLTVLVDLIQLGKGDCSR